LGFLEYNIYEQHQESPITFLNSLVGIKASKKASFALVIGKKFD